MLFRSMRTTVTLDPDVEATLKAAAREKGISFKQALNDAVRAGTRNPARARSYVAPSQRLGARQGFNIDKATQLAGDLDDLARLGDVR